MNYKKDIKEISDIIDQLITLLISVDEDEWLVVLKSFRNDCEFVENEQDANRIRREILHIYGGMGSFSDFDLGSFDESGYFIEHKQGNKLSSLKTKLFDTILNQLEK